MTGELTSNEISNILSSQVIGRLAISDGRQPYIMPVTYAYDGRYIYCQSNEGLKLDILRKNPRVCFEIDMMTDMRNWKSVIITGHFEELKHDKAEKARAVLFNNVFPLMTASTVHTHEHGVSAVVDDSTRVKQVMYRIIVKKITGRFEKQ